MLQWIYRLFYLEHGLTCMHKYSSTSTPTSRLWIRVLCSKMRPIRKSRFWHWLYRLGCAYILCLPSLRRRCVGKPFGAYPSTFLRWWMDSWTDGLLIYSVCSFPFSSCIFELSFSLPPWQRLAKKKRKQKVNNLWTHAALFVCLSFSMFTFYDCQMTHRWPSNCIGLWSTGRAMYASMILCVSHTRILAMIKMCVCVVVDSIQRATGSFFSIFSFPFPGFLSTDDDGFPCFFVTFPVE